MPPRNQQAVIAMLEEALEAARAGDVREMVMLIVHGDNLSFSGMYSPSDNLFDVVGKLERLKQHVLRRMDDDG